MSTHKIKVYYYYFGSCHTHTQSFQTKLSLCGVHLTCYRPMLTNCHNMIIVSRTSDLSEETAPSQIFLPRRADFAQARNFYPHQELTSKFQGIDRQVQFIFNTPPPSTENRGHNWVLPRRLETKQKP